jgi:hypothetical protein
MLDPVKMYGYIKRGSKQEYKKDQLELSKVAVYTRDICLAGQAKTNIP